MFSVLFLAFWSCTTHEPDTPPRYKRDYFFNGLFVPIGIYVKPIALQSELNLCLMGTMYDYHYERTVSLLKEYRDRVGDVYRSKFYLSEFPDEGTTIPYGVKGFRIEALDEYNATHPMGSDLADIVKVSYFSYDKYFLNQTSYKPGGFTFGERLGDIRELAGGLNIRFPWIKKCNFLKRNFLIQEEDDWGLLRIHFQEIPIQPKVRLRFVLTLEDDTRFECAEEVEIRQVSKAKYP